MRKFRIISQSLSLVGLTYLVFSLINWSFKTSNWGGFSLFVLGLVGIVSIINIIDEF